MLYWKASVYIRSTYEINPHQPTSFESNMLGIPFLLMAALLNTGNMNLVESSYDDLWGTGIPLSDPSALNETQWKSIGLLGKMLMVIRSEKIPIISGNRDVETEENMSSTSN